MRTLPYADPGTPNIDGPWRLLGWIARGQMLTLAIGGPVGLLPGCVAQALIPVAVGKGIGEGVVGGDGSDLLLWSGVVLGLAVRAGAARACCGTAPR